MKRNFIKIVFIFITVFTLLFGYLEYERYKIPPQMKDIEYKKAIIKDSHNIFYRLENLNSLVGEEELTEFIKANNNNPQIYTPNDKNLGTGTFRANLHMHTINSDGKASVQQRLDAAQSYAENYIKDGYMYIAITDHNTILGAKDVIKILQKYPHKYKNIKVIAGIEIYTKYKTAFSSKPVDIHVLTWCINPYDKFLNKEFFKADLNDKCNRGKYDRDFNQVIKMMSKYGIPGIAHPLRYTVHMKDKKYPYIDELFKKYSEISSKPLFTEGYYQVYPRYKEKKILGNEYETYKNYINTEADKQNIIKTGSTDSHGFTITD